MCILKNKAHLPSDAFNSQLAASVLPRRGAVKGHDRSCYKVSSRIRRTLATNRCAFGLKVCCALDLGVLIFIPGSGPLQK